ncbi:MAG: D-aminoacyl-tRNA deacylase [Chloroflexota bacterium]|nr:D-aminoacyl-tRNA deacylase [Chloroflexota bacterium]
MRILIQRVTQASVTVGGETVGAIGPGLALLIGIGEGDTAELVESMCQKVVDLRIFDDADGRMNRSALDLLDAGEQPGMLVVSQFTLYGDLRRGRRPSYSHAAPPEVASPLVDACAEWLRKTGLTVGTGVFGAEMQVALVNDGPVTLWLDSSEMKRPRRA